MATRGRASGRSGRPADRGGRAPGDAARRATGGPTSGDLTAYRARLREVVAPVADSAGYDLEDLSVVRMGRRYVIRVTVDRDGGVGLDAVAELSRDISERLDSTEASDGEFIAGEYQLEVSSPGTDRPLTAPRHWRRNVGRLVSVKLDGRAVTGRIVGAGDETATLAVGGNEVTRGYDELGRGRVEIEFARLDDVDDDDLIAFPDDVDDDDVDTLMRPADESRDDVPADRRDMDDDDMHDDHLDDDEFGPGAPTSRATRRHDASKEGER
ncbi:MAG TPA: ribosome maturation factor RimP [Micromonosporaceae bacterium]